MFGLNDALRAIRAGRWTVIGCLLAGLAVAGVLSATAVRSYVSTTELFVSVTRTPDAPSAYQGSLFTQERMESYAQLMGTSQLAQGVVDDLGLPLTADQVVGKVTAVAVPHTDILDVTVTDTAAERAQAIAASLGRQLAQQVTELETSDAAQGPMVQVRAVQPATFKPTPVSPVVSRYLAVGAALGLLVGLGLALTRQRLSAAVRTVEDVQNAADTPWVARLFQGHRLSKLPVSHELDASPPTTKAFRMIRLGLERADRGSRPQVIVVTSATPGEGKSTVAVGLSVSLARSGSRVMLVEGNLWRPRVTRYLGLAASDRGLTDVLTGTAALKEVTLSSNQDHLSVLPAGFLPEDPGEILGSAEMRTLLETLRGSHDYVVIDTPALLPVVDAAALSALADGALLVTRYGKTRRSEFAEAAAAIAAVDAQLLGVVLNRVPLADAAPAERRRFRPDSSRTKAPPAGLRASRRSELSDDGSDDGQQPDVLPAGSGHS